MDNARELTLDDAAVFEEAFRRVLLKKGLLKMPNPIVHLELDLTERRPLLAAAPRIEQFTEFTLGVFPTGMASGKPSVAMIVRREDGSAAVIETSWAALYTAVRGIEARYGIPE